MQLLNFLPLAFVASAIASPLAAFEKRDAADVIAGFGTISEKAQALDASVVAYQGGNAGFIDALKIQQQSSDLLKAINDTTNAANASPPFTDDESVNVGIAVNDLSPVVIQLLDDLKNKKAAFDSGFIPLSPIVLLSLKDQRAATQKLTDAVVAKVSDQFKDVAPALTQPIFDKFDEVIKVYSSGGFGGFPSFPKN